MALKPGPTAPLPTFEGYGQGRRRKAALVLVLVWGGTLALHLISWGIWVVLGLTTLMGWHAVRLLWVRRTPGKDGTSAELGLIDWPSVTLLVAAKNEEAVIGRVVESLCQLDYPRDAYELWVVDDNSSDRTGTILTELTQRYPQLRVWQRPAGATGGKSGALNEILAHTVGDIIGVFDADAQAPPELLRQAVAQFTQPRVGAVQVRKAIAPGPANLWLRGQRVEMVLDAFLLQQQRHQVGGVVELRGNGQFVRRSALVQAGGWNEETITDDLDLSFRLHLDGWDIAFLYEPPVLEEGVTTAVSLWHQRNRWAEGGYQRYLDYWWPLLHWPWGFWKRFDLCLFCLTQYLLPVALLPDWLFATVRGRPPVLWPVTSVTVLMSLAGLWLGLRQLRPRRPAWQDLGDALFGTVYMLHWLPVMISMTLRVAVRPKRLRWVKTIHHGSLSQGPSPSAETPSA
ncbi:MAG: glycosyltransferase family 2 protein [Gloeomargaritaceae cyanobacterium C42_A2020_066]|nr:glycosyltransferase family 2 protein [Gloeomargaritaceae cyanobacterium C42_A2020_066]